jgi:hypothetical protein
MAGPAFLIARRSWVSIVVSVSASCAWSVSVCFPRARVQIHQLVRYARHLVLIMSQRQPRPYDDIARKWHALAERRRAHVVELRDSGRWRHYYTWDGLLEALREAVATCDTWARLAGLAEDETPTPTNAAIANEAPHDWLDVEFFRKAG